MTNNHEVTYPHVTVQLSKTDSNVFAIIGAVRHALRTAGVSRHRIQDFTDEATSQGSYDDVIALVMRTVAVE